MAAHLGLMSKYSLAISTMIAPASPVAIFVDGTFSRGVCFENLKNQGSLDSIDSAKQLLRTLLDGFDVWTSPSPSHKLSYIQISARDDGFISVSSSESLYKRFTSLNSVTSELRWVNGGHVSAFVFHQELYIQAIVDSFRLLKQNT